MVLHTFGDGTDGAHPFSIAFGKGGSIIGNATDGGASSAGMMFQLNKPVSHGDPWTETALWNFSGTGSDGAQPIGNLAVGKKGAIYGTTEGGGGGPANYGTVFELTP
jgi:hypothetical protein